MRKHKILKIFLIILAAVLLIAIGYVVYVFTSYYRLGDTDLVPEKDESKQYSKAALDTEYKIISWNIGFGANDKDFSFFMDGGTESWAKSEDVLNYNMNNISSFLTEKNADFCFIQEADTDSTRSYHVNEYDILKKALKNHVAVFCQNFDSPFLFYPFTEPHGIAKSGLITFSAFDITKSNRVELPIETSLSKILDCDRCYSVSRVPIEGGKELVLINFHLSAYASDKSIADGQLEMVLDFMKSEYEKGNYCVAGGDFNHDLLGDSAKIFGKKSEDLSWTQPIPTEFIEKSGMTLIAPYDEASPIPSCRNLEAPYNEDQFVVVIDGFMVSPNVTVKSSNVYDCKFEFSDHNPVYMDFVLTDK